MELYELLLIFFALAVVGTDAFVRLRLVPNRRDSYVGNILQADFGPIGELGRFGKPEDPETHVEPVANSLLMHFEQSFASRNIVKTLALAPSGLTERELEQRFSELTTEAGKRTLPSNAVRKVIMILMGADFVSLRNGKLAMTELGWKLHDLLQSRRKKSASGAFRSQAAFR